MNIKKLNSASVGTHHGEQAMILTEKGEIYVTKNEWQEEGYELVKFQTYDLNQLSSMLNHLLKGIAVNGKATVQLRQGSIYVNPVVKLYLVELSDGEDSLLEIVGGFEGQVISIMSNQNLRLQSNQQLILEGEFMISSSYSIIMLQKSTDQWIELSRKENQ